MEIVSIMPLPHYMTIKVVRSFYFSNYTGFCLIIASFVVVDVSTVTDQKQSGNTLQDQTNEMRHGNDGNRKICFVEWRKGRCYELPWEM